MSDQHADSGRATMTGAQALVRSLEEVGVDGRIRHPGRRDPAAVRPAVRLHQGPAHPGPPRAGRRARRRGLRPGDRTGRRLHRDLGPGRHQPGHPDRRRLHGLGADRRDHRPGAARRDRHRRLPGGRHLRHHAADHQAQLPGAAPRGHRRRRSPRRSTSPRPAGPGPSSSTCPRTCCRPATEFRWPPEIDLPGYHPVSRPHGKQIREAAKLIASARRPVLYVGGGVLKSRATRRAARAGRADRHPAGHHADGPRRVPRQPPAAPGHARHARLGRGGHRAAEGRPADRARHPLRRPGHRQARHVRAARRDHPRRHRPGRDRQEPHRRRADRRRRARGADRADPGDPGRVRRRPPRRPDRLVAAARPVAHAATRSATTSRPTARWRRST